MSLTTKQKHDIKKFVKELELYRGLHTELVTVYIPAGYELVKIIQHLAQEQGTASNIKSASTRKNVQDALERMIQHLRLFKKTPDNGLAAFAGNIASAEGKRDVNVWSIEPPIALNTRMYKCDKVFHLDILRDMMESKEAYGLVVMDRRDAQLALLKGKTIIPLQKTHSEVPGKMKAGGQSAHRFSENRELAAKAHYRKIGEYMKEQFFNKEGLKGIIVGGPGPTKYEFVDGDNMITDLRKKIIAIKDITYTDEFGLQELVDKSQDVLAKEELAEEKTLMNNFLETLGKNSKKVSYGEKHTLNALKLGAVDILLLSEDLEDSKIEMFEAEAKKVGTTVKIISTETREGVQLRDLGKVGAMLRYEVHTE